MEMTPEARSWLSQLRESLVPKPGLLKSVFGAKPKPADQLEPSEILEGLTFQGYRFAKLLGVGAVGAVFAATRESDGEHLAIKAVHLTEQSPEAQHGLFEREVEIGRTLSHPGIVKTYETLKSPLARFLVMELIRGETLTEALREPWPLSRVLEVFTPVADGLQHAHDKGVVHRDLKPDNIILNEEGEARILDFGLASLKGSAELTLTGQFKGTISYTAPEQLQDTKSVTGACDQFALGMILFQALSGRTPYEEKKNDPMGAIFARLSQPALPLTQVCESASKGTEAVLQRMLARLPDDRFPTVAEAFAALSSSS